MVTVLHAPYKLNVIFFVKHTSMEPKKFNSESVYRFGGMNECMDYFEIYSFWCM